jgi:hypothetical protein
MRFRRSRLDVDRYCAGVADYLAGEFGWGRGVAHACRDFLSGEIGRYGDRLDHIEFICDDSARFRLKADHRSEGPALRMAFYPVTNTYDPESPGAQQADAITAHLASLLAEARGEGA